MAFNNTDVALALLETIVLLLPFIALVFQAMVPENTWIRMEKTVWWDPQDPRNLMAFISIMLVFALAMVLTYFTANFSSELSVYLTIAISLISVATGFTMYFVIRLVSLRRNLTMSDK